jgi:hypothetical protein
MSIIHGSTGLIYFVHEWEPKFNESALLSDPLMLVAVTDINRRLGELAPVLNSPTISGRLGVTTNNADAPVAVMVKKHEDAIYVFAVSMRSQAVRAEFVVRGMTGSRSVTVLDENRAIETRDGAFADNFAPWDVHLYQIAVGTVP